MVIFAFWFPAIGFMSAMNTGKTNTHPTTSSDKQNTLSCLNVDFVPNVVTCGTTSITAYVNCNFSGTVQMQAIGNPANISFPAGNLVITNGVFYFDVEVAENAPGIVSFVTTVTAVWNDPTNCVLDQVCEPSVLVTTCTVPENNDCANAVDIPVGELTCEYGIYSNDLWSSSGMAGSCSANDDKDIFFRFTANFETTYVHFGEIPSNSMTFQLFESSCLGDQLYCISMGAHSQLTLSNLSPGESYIIRVSDLPGDNTGLIELCVWSPLSCNISLTKTVQNEICLDDCMGSATVVPLNGTPPFTYAWSDGQNTPTAENLCAGTYFVEITDAYGCILQDSVNIGQGMLFTADAGEDINICSGETVQLEASAGTNYRWSPASGLDNPNIRNPMANPDTTINYSVSILNEYGCKSTDSLTVFVHENPTPRIVGDTLSCAGDSVWLSSEIATYATYTWSTGDTSQSIHIGKNGLYQLIVTDTLGCAGLAKKHVSFLAPITNEFNIEHESGNGFNNGQVSVESTGGLAPYAYQWSNGDTMTTMQSLSPGNYFLTVTDNFGCQSIDSVIIDPFVCPEIGLVSTVTDPSCFGVCDGSIVVENITGTTGPVDWLWSNGNQSDSLLAVCAGSFTLTITDSLNCSKQDTFRIIDPEVLEIILDDITHVYAGQPGSINLSMEGPYSFVWSTVSGFYSNAQNLTVIDPGCYDLTVTDTLTFCTADTTFCVDDLTSTKPGIEKTGIYLYPNPVNEALRIYMPQGISADTEVRILSLSGKLWQTRSLASAKAEWVLSLHDLPSGIYFVELISTKGKIVKRIVKTY